MRVLLLAMLMLVAVPAQARKGADGASRPSTGAAALAELTQLMRAADNGPHPAGSGANARVGEAIAAALRDAGLRTQWQRGVRCSPRGCTYVANLLAIHTVDPRADYLVFSAHYDTAPASPGAADDMMAVAALTTFARSVPARRRNIALVFLDAEEVGQLGASLFRTRHPLADRIEFVVNTDVLGARGPLVAFDFGPRPGVTAARLAAAPSDLIASGLVNDAWRFFPNQTDLAALTAGGAPGVSVGFVLGDDAYHLPGDTIGRIAADRLEALCAFYDRMATAPAGGGGGLVLHAPPGVRLLLPRALPAILALLAAAMLAWATIRRSRVARREVATAVFWLGTALASAFLMAFLARIAIVPGSRLEPLLTMLAPLWPPLALWTILAVAAPRAHAGAAVPAVLLVIGVAAMAWMPSTALALLGAAVLYQGAALASRDRPLLPALAAAAFLLLAAAPLLAVGGRLAQPAALSVVNLLWLVVWLPTAGLFTAGDGLARPRLLAGLTLLAGIAGGVTAFAKPGARAPALDVDRIDRRDTGLSRAVLRDEDEDRQRPAGFVAGGPAAFPWAERSDRAATRPLPCCAPSAAASASVVQPGRTRLRFPADGSVVTYTLFMPAPGPASALSVAGQTIAVATLPASGGYRYFTLRGHPPGGWTVDVAGGLAGTYLVAERPMAGRMRASLLGRQAAMPSGYVPGRTLTIDLAAPASNEGS